MARPRTILIWWLYEILNIGMTCGFFLMASCSVIERNVFHNEVLRKTCDSNKLRRGENCMMKTDTVPPLDEVITSIVGAVKQIQGLHTALAEDYQCSAQ
jgi:hypothetical protein